MFLPHRAAGLYSPVRSIYEAEVHTSTATHKHSWHIYFVIAKVQRCGISCPADRRYPQGEEMHYNLILYEVDNVFFYY